MALVKMPRYVMFTDGDNDKYLCLHEYKMDHPFLSFNCAVKTLFGAHEVIPVPGLESVVMIKSLYNDHFWRMSPSQWIWADQSHKPSTDNRDCLFKVVHIGHVDGVSKVALQCLANDRYLKRYTEGGVDNCLSALATNHFKDSCAQLKVTEALSHRRVFDVTYLYDQLQITRKEPTCLVTNTATNSSRSNTDVTVSLTFDNEKRTCWRDSTTVTTGMSVEFTAGIPDFGFSQTMSMSKETINTIEFGKETAEKRSVTGTFTIKDVAPGDTACITVKGTEAYGTVPFKYKFQDTRVDGLTMEEDTAVDGVFMGVQVMDVKWEATDSRGAPKEVIQIKEFN